jgi:hypothetical protein
LYYPFISVEHEEELTTTAEFTHNLNVDALQDTSTADHDESRLAEPEL